MAWNQWLGDVWKLQMREIIDANADMSLFIRKNMICKHFQVSYVILAFARFVLFPVPHDKIVLVNQEEIWDKI